MSENMRNVLVVSLLSHTCSALAFFLKSQTSGFPMIAPISRNSDLSEQSRSPIYRLERLSGNSSKKLQGDPCRPIRTQFRQVITR